MAVTGDGVSLECGDAAEDAILKCHDPNRKAVSIGESLEITLGIACAAGSWLDSQREPYRVSVINFTAPLECAKAARWDSYVRFLLDRTSRSRLAACAARLVASTYVLE